MREDLSLKRTSGIMAILAGFFLIVLLAFFTIDYFNNGFLNEFFYWFVNSGIWISSGVFGSSFVLWFTKKYDYKNKLNDLLTEYFYTSFKYCNMIRKINPIMKGYRNSPKTGEIYRDFYDKKDIYNELKQLKSKFKFDKNSKEIEKTINNIDSFFTRVTPSLVWNASFFNAGYNEPGSIDTMVSSNEKLFKISSKKNLIVYNNLTEFDLIPELKKLEKYLFGEVTIKELDFPSAVIFKSTYDSRLDGSDLFNDSFLREGDVSGLDELDGDVPEDEANDYLDSYEALDDDQSNKIMDDEKDDDGDDNTDDSEK